MNFRRIQWIFLIAFIILDLVLVSTLLWGNEKLSHQRQATEPDPTNPKGNEVQFDYLPQVEPQLPNGVLLSGDPRGPFNGAGAVEKTNHPDRWEPVDR